MGATQSPVDSNRTPDGIRTIVSVLASPLWGWVAAAVMAGTYFSAVPEHQYSGAIVSAVTFALVPSLMPGCRLIAKTPLCPWNWALFLFGLELIVLPFSILAVGPSLGVLPSLPSRPAINTAMLLSSLAFLVFSASYQYLFRTSVRQKQTRLASSDGDGSEAVYPARMAQVYVVLGVLGLFLAFGNLSGFLGYFEDPATYVDRFVQASHTLSGVASLLLRPFLGFGLVMLWCRWLDLKSQSKSAKQTALITLLGIVGVVLSYATFSYNRGAFVVPLVSMVTVLMARGKRVSLGVLVLAGSSLIIVLFLAPFYAIFRNTGLTGSRTAVELLSDPAISDFFTENIDLIDTVQMYGSGPQYMGYLLEESHWGTRPYLGSTLFPSLVQPLPIIGRIFSESSGPMIYNEMIYGTPGIFDQIVPFASEMFLNFNVFGIVAGFCFLGVVAFWLQRGFERATSSLEIYIWQYTAVWVLFLILGSISVVMQILFYFYSPIFVLLGRKHWVTKEPKGHPEWQVQP